MSPFGFGPRPPGLFPPFRPPLLIENSPEVDPDVEFYEKLRKEGFDDDLIEKGIKVANNHSRERREALKIGENYVREMSK